MTKKIVAIGGGENGRYLGNGKYREYETEPMDKEIIRLTGKENPNYLFMVHAQPFNNAIEEGYFETMKKIYGDMFGCNCMYLKSTELDDMEVVRKNINTNKEIMVTSTSCNIVDFATFKEEIIRNNFKIIKCYISSDIPNFDKCICAIISK